MLNEVYRSLDFRPEQPYRVASLHNHTELSDGHSSYKDLLEAGVKAGIDVIVITDHDTVAGGKRARDWAEKKRYPIEVKPGSEITIAGGGHLLGIGIEEDIPPFLSLDQTIYLIHKLGGLAIAPHPFYRRLQGGSLGRNNMMHVAGSDRFYNRLDGVEIFNGGVAAMRGSVANEEALLFYLTHMASLGAAVGGSDTHNLEVSSVLTAFQGEDLFDAIRHRRTAVFHQDRQTRQKSFNDAVAIIGEDLFKNVPLFIKRRMNRQAGRVQAFALQTEDVSEFTASSFLTIPELTRFRSLREQRRNAWFSSRIALKAAYCVFTNQELESMRFLAVGNKIFGNSKSGPPYIMDGEDLYYSLAHSGDIGVGAVGDIPVGVDLERVNHLRPPRIGLLSDAEIIEEGILDPDLDLHEIGQKRGSIREAVGKGLLIGNSRRSSFKIVPENSTRYTVEPFRDGVALPVWKVDVVKRGDYFLTVAVGTLSDAKIDLSWINRLSL